MSKHEVTKATRRQPPIVEEDYGGQRAILDNRYKLVVEADSERELFDMSQDESEQQNIAEENPEVAAKLAQELRGWQESVLKSLTEADYG